MLAVGLKIHRLKTGIKHCEDSWIKEMSTNSVVDLIAEMERELNDGLDFHSGYASSVGSVNFNAANMCRLPRDVRASIFKLQNKILQSPNNLYRARGLLVDLIKQKVEELHPTDEDL